MTTTDPRDTRRNALRELMQPLAKRVEQLLAANHSVAVMDANSIATAAARIADEQLEADTGPCLADLAPELEHLKPLARQLAEARAVAGELAAAIVTRDLAVDPTMLRRGLLYEADIDEPITAADLADARGLARTFAVALLEVYELDPVHLRKPCRELVESAADRYDWLDRLALPAETEAPDHDQEAD